MPTIYTIGHSTHPADYFLELLTTHSINCVVDVRSVPASRFNPQFNKNRLAEFLGKNNITYLHFAQEFGARRTDPSLLDEERRVDFGKVRASEDFKKGIERIRQGVEKGFSIALMCAESDPLECHRFLMISTALQDAGFEVRHILKDKSSLSNSQLEDQLLKKYHKKLVKPGIFASNLTAEARLIVWVIRKSDFRRTRENSEEEKGPTEFPNFNKFVQLPITIQPESL
jgi:uncharacterized protein (DUF488 family)